MDILTVAEKVVLMVEKMVEKMVFLKVVSLAVWKVVWKVGGTAAEMADLWAEMSVFLMVAMSAD